MLVPKKHIKAHMYLFLSQGFYATIYFYQAYMKELNTWLLFHFN